MVIMWEIKLSKQALKDRALLKGAGLEDKAKQILSILAVNPFSPLPKYEKLIGDCSGFYSRRLNIQHRLVYRVDEENHVVYVDSMWSHCER